MDHGGCQVQEIRLLLSLAFPVQIYVYKILVPLILPIYLFTNSDLYMQIYSRWDMRPIFRFICKIPSVWDRSLTTFKAFAILASNVRRYLCSKIISPPFNHAESYQENLTLPNFSNLSINHGNSKMKRQRNLYSQKWNCVTHSQSYIDVSVSDLYIFPWSVFAAK